MHTQRNSTLLRHMVLGALFAASMLKPPPAHGYTMVVWGDTGDWGCIGSCGGDGYYEPLGDWSGSGDSGGGGGGGGGEDGSAEWPHDLPVRTPGNCSPPSTRAARASAVVRQYVLMTNPDITTCDFDLQRGQHFFLRFEETGLGSTYRWSGDCDLDDPAPNFLTEVSSQCPTN